MGLIVTYFHDLRLLRIVSGAKTCLKLVKAFRDPTVLTWLKNVVSIWTLWHGCRGFCEGRSIEQLLGKVMRNTAIFNMDHAERNTRCEGGSNAEPLHESNNLHLTW